MQKSIKLMWVLDESYTSPKGHHQVGASPIGYQCLVILHTRVLYSSIAVSSAIDLVMLFFVQMVASNNHSDVEEEDEEEELFASSSWLYVWRSCWLASVACVGLFSSAYPIVIVFCNHLVSWMSASSACSLYFRSLSLRIPHCSSLLALLYSPMSLDSGKRKSETVRHTTWIKVHWKRNKTYTHLIHLMLAE